MYLLSMLGVGNQARQMHLELSKTKTKERVEMGTGREDPLDGVISSGMVFTQLKENAALLVIAGSETTATLLTGAIFLLTTQSDVLRKLALEVRGRFKDETDITLTSINGFSYIKGIRFCTREYKATNDHERFYSHAARYRATTKELHKGMYKSSNMTMGKQGRKIAIVGASGTIGDPTLAAMVGTGIHIITVLSRATSDTSFPAGVQVKKGNYNDQSFLISALQGQDVVLLTIGRLGRDSQIPII